MKTTIPLRNTTLHANALSIGSILIDRKNIPAEKMPFTVIGISHREIAMARVFESVGINNILEKKCYHLSHGIKYKLNEEPFETPIYIDCSRLVIKNYTLFASLLDKDPGILVGSISKPDLNKIIEMMRTASTIAQSVKDKYFPL